MVDREPGEYRPRRAYIEPEPTEQDAASADTGTPEQRTGGSRGSRYEAAEYDHRPARRYGVDQDAGDGQYGVDQDAGDRPYEPEERADSTGRYGRDAGLPQSRNGQDGSRQSRWNGNGYRENSDHGDFGHLPPRRSIFADLDTEDQPRPLYRDEQPYEQSRPQDYEPQPYEQDRQQDYGQPYEQDRQDSDEQPNVHQLYEQRPYRAEDDEGYDDPFAQPYQEVTRPLYRSEQPASPNAGEDAEAQVRAAPSESTQRLRVRDEEATTRLPRTASGSRNTRDWQDSIDDFDDLDDRPRIGRRTKLALVIAGVAAVVIAGLIVGYAVLQQAKAPTTTPSAGSTATNQPTTSVEPNPTSQPSAVALTDDSMINAKDAKLIDAKRTWKVASTQHGRSKESLAPACLGGDPVEGQPTPQQTVLRTLSSSGKIAPAILHEADVYTSVPEATQAYAVAAKRLGGCVEPGGWIESGWTVSGVGDQSLGLIVGLVDGTTTTHHSVVLSRTGVVMNVADVAQTPDPVPVAKVAKAVAAAVNAQCQSSGGRCAGSLAVKAGPPPLGGDAPGFLAAGDLPPVKGISSLWVGNDPDVPAADFVGAQCENVDWAKTPALDRTARTYLLQEGSDPGFGLDEIVLTMKSAKAAASFANTLETTVTRCPKLKLTATVPKPNTVKGVGAGGSAINGWTVTVTQKATDRTNKYRLGVVTVGSKVVYSFLSPKGAYDLTDAQWNAVAVRAGERASQTK